jgi:hypothetical protein
VHVTHTGSGAHPASRPLDTGISFPGVKWREADPSLATGAEVKKTWIYIFPPPPTRLRDVVLNSLSTGTNLPMIYLYLTTLAFPSVYEGPN